MSTLFVYLLHEKGKIHDHKLLMMAIFGGFLIDFLLMALLYSFMKR